MIIILIVWIITIAMIIRIMVIIVNYWNQAMLPKHTITIFPHFSDDFSASYYNLIDKSD